MWQRVVNLWRSRHPVWRVARIVVLVVVGLGGFLMWREESLIFFPSPYPEGDWEINQRRGREGEVLLRAEDVWLTASDGVRLHGWFLTPHRVTDGTPQPVPYQAVLLFCHGNAGNITDRTLKAGALITAPMAVLVFDYRGYGRSAGRPNERGVYRDADAAWAWLTGERGIAPERIVIYGESLGGAVAIDLAGRVLAAGLITESTFTSIPAMAAATMPWVPRFIIRTQMDSLAKIPAVRGPKLFIHSPDDEVVPYHMAEALFAAAREPKQFLAIPGAGHNELDLVGGERYAEAVREFVRRVTPAAPAP
jgi:hypothetical protein